jgi:hypothetical protein
VLQRSPGRERCGDPWYGSFTVVLNDGIYGLDEKGLRIGRGGVASDDDRHSRREPPHASGQREHIISLEGMHGRNADEAWACRAKVMVEGLAESKVGERNGVTVRFKRRGDVLHPEWFDAEEWT